MSCSYTLYLFCRTAGAPSSLTKSENIKSEDTPQSSSSRNTDQDDRTVGRDSRETDQQSKNRGQGSHNADQEVGSVSSSAAREWKEKFALPEDTRPKNSVGLGCDNQILSGRTHKQSENRNTINNHLNEP